MASLQRSNLWYVFMLLSIGRCCHQPQHRPLNSPSLPSCSPATGHGKGNASNPWIGHKSKRIYQASVPITSDESWLLALGIDPKGGMAVVVNASE